MIFDKNRRLDNLSKMEPFFQTEDGVPYEIPNEGSLGLLALGHVGLLAWRAKRLELTHSKPENLD